jgi:hypothetical protein
MTVWLARLSVVIVLAASAVLAPGRSQAASSPCTSLAPAIPPRPADARSGSAFADAVAELSEHDRDRAIRGEVLAGNMPAFLRRLQPVMARALSRSGKAVQVVFCALPDYLSVGADDDFMAAPMSLPSALAIGARFGFMLPTRRMVDLIYQQASVRLAPQPLPAGEQMRSIGYFRVHDALVREQRSAIGAAPGQLTAGHKKDVVLSARLWQQTDRVPIYGWHRGVGAPIQPLSTFHGARYVDYSHGVRLVSDAVFVDGERRSLFDVLADAELAPLLSDEGPLPHAGQLARAGTSVALGE